MIISPQSFQVNGLHYTIRSATPEDAKELSAVRLQVDGETEHMDRIPGKLLSMRTDLRRLLRTIRSIRAIYAWWRKGTARSWAIPDVRAMI